MVIYTAQSNNQDISSLVQQSTIVSLDVLMNWIKIGQGLEMDYNRAKTRGQAHTRYWKLVKKATTTLSFLFLLGAQNEETQNGTAIPVICAHLVCLEETIDELHRHIDADT